MPIETPELPKLSIRPFRTIVSDLASGQRRRQGTAWLRKVPCFVGKDYIRLLGKLRGVEVSGDCRFCDIEDARDQNRFRDNPKCGLGEKWWLLATAGTGDAWLLRAGKDGRSRVAFLDHDEEDDATAHAMGIHLDQWFQLADLMRQMERAERTNPALCDSRHATIPAFRKLVRMHLNRISRGLANRYPYRI